MPLIYIELGRPRDFIKGGLNLVIGMLLIYKKNSFNTLNYLIFNLPVPIKCLGGISLNTFIFTS